MAKQQPFKIKPQPTAAPPVKAPRSVNAGPFKPKAQPEAANPPAGPRQRTASLPSGMVKAGPMPPIPKGGAGKGRK